MQGRWPNTSAIRNRSLPAKVAVSVLWLGCENNEGEVIFMSDKYQSA